MAFLSAVGGISFMLPLANAASFAPYPYFPPNVGGSVQSSESCLAEYRSSNASGTYSWGPSVINGGISGQGLNYAATGDLSWTVTVSQNMSNAGNLESSLWLGQPPGVDLRLGDLEFSGCIFSMGGLSQNLIRRAQTDNGSCEQMLDDKCVNALQSQLETIAHGYTASFTDESPAPGNLSAGSLPRVCSLIQQDFTNNGAVPSECAEFVGPSLSWNDGTYSNISFTHFELTGPNSTTDTTCSFNTSSSIPSFSVPGSNLSYITGSSSGFDSSTSEGDIEIIYDEAVTNVYPVFTVLFPPANDSDRSKSISSEESFLICLRPVNITSGSRTPAALPSPTPLRKIPHVLSSGTIAGVVVGVVGGVLVLGGAILFVLRRRRQQKKAAEIAIALEQVEQSMKDQKEALLEQKAPMLGSQTVHDVQGDARAEMLGTRVYAELGDTSKVTELNGVTHSHAADQ